MTKKQYKVGYFEDPNPVDDYVECDGEYLDASDVVRLLSKFQEENEELRQAYQTLKHRHSLLHDVCIEAECDRDSLKKDVISLEKENEKLKGEVKRLKCINKQLEERLDRDIALNMDCGDVE